jgi:hypothetical protein
MGDRRHTILSISALRLFKYPLQSAKYDDRIRICASSQSSSEPFFLSHSKAQFSRRVCRVEFGLGCRKTQRLPGPWGTYRWYTPVCRIAQELVVLPTTSST